MPFPAFWEGFYSKKLQEAEKRYSTFGRELLAIYLTLRHFRYALEGRCFTIFTDHKPLVYAFTAKSDRLSQREIRHLDYISQYTTDIQHVKGEHNLVADALSRNVNSLETVTDTQFNVDNVDGKIDFEEIISLQKNDEQLVELRKSSVLKLIDVPLGNVPGTIVCEISTGIASPYIPLDYRKVAWNSTSWY